MEKKKVRIGKRQDVELNREGEASDRPGENKGLVAEWHRHVND